MKSSFAWLLVTYAVIVSTEIPKEEPFTGKKPLWETIDAPPKKPVNYDKLCGGSCDEDSK